MADPPTTTMQRLKGRLTFICDFKKKYLLELAGLEKTRLKKKKKPNPVGFLGF
jgi:hypothetical protein